MADDVNPCRSPALDALAASSGLASRSAFLRKRWVFLAGAVLGCVSFLIAMAFVPSDVDSPSQHDLLLANYLGFVFPPIVGLWSGWVRRSWRWAAFGLVIGMAIGAAYRLLCGHDFLFIMVAFPCLLGGAASAALGSGVRSWFDGILARMAKGLVAGFVLGFVYMVVLNGLGIGWFPIDSMQRYHKMMCQNGPVAMSLAGGCYLVLFVWASNLREVVLTTHDSRSPSA
jgi:hypothetical protein